MSIRFQRIAGTHGLKSPKISGNCLSRCRRILQAQVLLLHSMLNSASGTMLDLKIGRILSGNLEVVRQVLLDHRLHHRYRVLVQAFLVQALLIQALVHQAQASVRVLLHQVYRVLVHQVAYLQALHHYQLKGI